MSAPIFAAEEKPKTNFPLILGLFAAAGGVYYLFMHVPRTRNLRLTGPDERINGEFQLIEEETTTRKQYDDNKLDYPNGEWANQVWQHKTKQDCYIYDHSVTNAGHTWCIGPWNPSEGGAIFMGRYAYISVSNQVMDTKVAKYKKSQTFIDIGRSANPLKSWDVMQFGFFHNGWTQCEGCVTYGWTHTNTGTIKLV